MAKVSQSLTVFDELVPIYPECPYAGEKILKGTIKETHHCIHPDNSYNLLCSSLHMFPKSANAWQCPFDMEKDQ